MELSLKKTGLLLMAFALTGCVTQTYENDKTTPVIKNESSNNEIAMTRISLGLGYLKMGNTTQAKLNLEKAKRFAPNLVQVYTAFAHYYDVVGEPELATQAFDKALTLNAKDADTALTVQFIMYLLTMLLLMTFVVRLDIIMPIMPVNLQDYLIV